MADIALIDVLREARKIYEANPSHAPSGSIPAGDSVCLVMAIDQATPTGDPYNYDAESVIAHHAGSDASLVRWNAEHSTEEVLAVFDRAIAAEEARDAA